jgi:hypothetical protein
MKGSSLDIQQTIGYEGVIFKPVQYAVKNMGG